LLFAHLENVRLALLNLAPAAQETAIIDLLRDVGLANFAEEHYALSFPVILAEFAWERDACKTGAIAEQFVLQIRAKRSRLHAVALLMVEILARHRAGGVVAHCQPNLSDRGER
jgi:hypothetical protein